MTCYKLSTSSYLLLLLHAQKYVHSITGLLLGKITNDSIEITDVLPLAHSDLTIHTTPLTETGLHLSEHYAKSKGVSIVGVYYANDVIDDPTLPTHVSRIASRIQQRFPRACIMRVDGTKLAPAMRLKEHCLVVHTGNTWRDSAVADVELRALALVEKAVSVTDVCDLEDHVLDPRADWMNADVLGVLERL